MCHAWINTRAEGVYLTILGRMRSMKHPAKNSVTATTNNWVWGRKSAWLLVPALLGTTWGLNSLLGSAPAPASSDSQPVASVPMTTLAQQKTPVSAGFQPTEFRNVTFRNAPSTVVASAQKVSSGAGMVYVKPGSARPNFGANRSAQKSAPQISQGTTAAGGTKMKLSPSQFPYMKSTTGKDGKVVVKCLEPMNAAVDHSLHNH